MQLTSATKQNTETFYSFHGICTCVMSDNTLGDDNKSSEIIPKPERIRTLEHYFGKPVQVSTRKLRKRKMENDIGTDVDTGNEGTVEAPEGTVEAPEGTVEAPASGGKPFAEPHGSNYNENADSTLSFENINAEGTVRNSEAKSSVKEKQNKDDEATGYDYADAKKRYSDSWSDDDYDIIAVSGSKGGWTSGWSTGWSSGRSSGRSSGWSSSIRDWSSWRQDGMEEYRKGYPNKKDSLSRNENLLFYTGQICSQPDHSKIDDIHKNWWGAYEFLEAQHGYIQWIFPIRESGGMNFYSQELQKHEAKSIIEDEKAHKRVLKSFRMMLDFFGMELTDSTTGKITRSKKFRSRFRNLNNSFHNYLRITRILKSLGEFDYEHLKKPWLEFFINEIYIEETLCNAATSCENYWVETLKDDTDRLELLAYISECNSKKRAENCDSENDYSPKMSRRKKKVEFESVKDKDAKKISREDSPTGTDMDIPSLLDD